MLVASTIDERHVARLTLSDPDRRNALRLEMTRALADAVTDALAAGARAIVLDAVPPVFCAGGSLDDLIEPRAPLEDTYAGYLALARCPVPTIAAVGGPCIGAGVNLPLACDVIVATPAARFDPRWLDVPIWSGGRSSRSTPRSRCPTSTPRSRSSSTRSAGRWLGPAFARASSRCATAWRRGRPEPRSRAGYRAVAHFGTSHRKCVQ